VSVAIAWVIENRGPPFYFPRASDGYALMVDAQGCIYDGTFQVQSCRRGADFIRLRRTDGLVDGFPPPPRWAVLPERVGERVRCRFFGWPATCLRDETVQRVIGSPSFSFTSAHVVRVPLRGHIVNFSYGVEWPGLLADTAAYAALIGAAWCAVHYSRRRTRGVWGCCAVCGYCRRGLAADAKCPECGTVPTK
jgi:hypothetical protein